MSYDLVQLAGRVQRLERDNRRLKLGAGGLVAVLVALPLVAAVLPAQVPEVIEAREFRVLDEAGTVRAGLGAYGLVFFTDLQEELARFGAGGLGFYSPPGTQRTHLGAYGLTFNDGFKDELEMRARLDAGGLRLYDEEGNMIARFPR